MMGRSENFAIFRRFNDMNMLNLMALQAEISDLRDRLYTQCEIDDAKGKDYSTSMLHLLESRKDSPENRKQYDLVIKIRWKMRQYNKLLLQVSELSKLEQPRGSYISAFREWLGDSKGGMSKGLFKNIEAWLWLEKDIRGENVEHDYVALAAPKVERDPFTRVVIYPLVRSYHALWGSKRLDKRFVVDEESQYVEYSEEKMEKVGLVMSTVIASILPVVAVLGLFFVKDLLKRIYIMIGITAGFAGLLAIMSNGKGKRIEIFAANAIDLQRLRWFLSGQHQCILGTRTTHRRFSSME